MERIGVYPGTFDPVTNGHLDIIKRASKLLDKLYVVVSLNIKKQTLFSCEERVNLIKEATNDIDNVIVTCYDGLIINYARDINATVIIRGIRAISDFENEFKLFSFNNDLDGNIETIILLAKPTHLFVSSSDVKELAKFNGDITKYVPKIVNDNVLNKYKQKNEQ